MKLSEICARVVEKGIVVLRGPAGDSPLTVVGDRHQLILGPLAAGYGGTLEDRVREGAVNAGLLPGESTRPRDRHGNPIVPEGWRWDCAKAEMLITEVEE
jgi:hypothetical protein